MSTALIVLAAGCEETETMSVADVLVRAGIEVTVAGAQALRFPGSRSLPMAADLLLDEVLDEALTGAYELVFLPGGMPQAEACRDDERIQRLIASQLAGPQVLALICACPIALIPGGHARGRRLTSFPGVRDRLTAAGADWQDAAVVVDGNLHTSQGPGTALAFGLHLAAHLVNEDVAHTIAEQMLIAR